MSSFTLDIDAKRIGTYDSARQQDGKSENCNRILLAAIAFRQASRRYNDNLRFHNMRHAMLGNLRRPPIGELFHKQFPINISV